MAIMAWVIANSRAKATLTDEILSMVSTVSFLPVEGKSYRMIFQIASYTGGSVRPVFGSTVFGASAETVGEYTYDIVASAGHATSKTHGLDGINFSGKVDDLQIYSLDETSFVYSYQYGGSDLSVYVVLHNLAYNYQRIPDIILSNANQSIPIEQDTDRVYANP